LHPQKNICGKIKKDQIDPPPVPRIKALFVSREIEED
jgi:hypothetical protein